MRIIKSSISALFFIISIILIMLLLSEAKFNKAKELNAGFRWKRAKKFYETAIRINPFNSEYLSDYGRYFLQLYQINKGGKYLEKAQKYYQKALYLNPRNADYAFFLAYINIKLGKNRKAVIFFKQAYKNDPNGSNLAYKIAYNSIELWNFLSDDEKQAILEKTKNIYGIKNHLHNYLLPKAWSVTKDADFINALVTEESILRIKQSLKKDNKWQGNSLDKKHEYKNGNMYWAGKIYKLIDLPSDKSTLAITARGTKAKNIWPYMIIELDGRAVGGAVVKSAKWDVYEFRIENKKGKRLLSIFYVNDEVDESKNEDRNLYLGNIHVAGHGS